ncbi:LysM peptidoglycan-binding domain-containing protein [Pseudaestuariivita sp.]|uniref:LysM peptidoglycan-binding domain-containing protein n=1 Tax=Pseudaestuariivita sp. TaxID=2211669 RepID=UPI0040585608
MSKITIDSAQRLRPIALGADLTQAPAIPPAMHSSVLRYAALGVAAFVLGCAVTLPLHRPDLLQFGASELDQTAPEVSRATGTPYDMRPLAEDVTLDLTAAQKAQIADVLSRVSSRTDDAATAPAPQPIAHSVAPGDTLASIATRYYGSAAYTKRLMLANETALQDGGLRPGLRLTVPPRPQELE